MTAPKRQRVGELMDDPAIDPREHHAALTGLARINTLSNAAGPVWRAIHGWARTRHAHTGSAKPIRLLDVATGSGDVAVAVKRHADRAGIPIELTLSDISTEACAAAEARARRAGVDVRTREHDLLSEARLEEHDIVMNSLFLHHLDEADVVSVLAVMRRASRGLVVVSDLVRSGLGLAMARTVPRVLTRSSVVHTDAVLSVRAAWTIDEMRGMCAQAGLNNAMVRPAWPQRQLVVWQADGGAS